MKTKAVKIIKKGRKHPIVEEFMRFFFIVLGAVLVGFGLEAFLIPNGFLDGGITGISIILSNFISVPVGFILAVLNIPFLILTWVKVGHLAAIRTAVGISALAITTIILHHMEPWTNEFVLALAYGGALLGLGVGLALRQGGALDGTEALASIWSGKSRFSVDQLILGINIFIFIGAAFVVGTREALASAALFYLAVAPIISKVVDGGSTLRRARVITNNPEEVAAAVRKVVTGRIVQEGSRVYDGSGFSELTGDISFNLPRLQEAVVLDVIIDADSEAVVTFMDISSLRGGIYEKSNH